MGLTLTSTGKKTSKGDLFTYNSEMDGKILIGLAGNPNVGKSTLFNNITGMHQHTGNWPGKTVTSAIGNVEYKNKEYVFADLPGTYSLLTHSKEEEVARDFICFAKAEKTVIVCDATCLERNLNLCLQIIEMTDNAIVCVNLIDEAERKGIKTDFEKLSSELGCRVVGIVASKKKSLKNLLDVLDEKSSFYSNVEIRYPSVVEECIEVMEKSLEKYSFLPFSMRWLAVNLITNEEEISRKVFSFFNMDLLKDEKIIASLSETEKIMERYGIDKEKFTDKVARTFVKKAEEISRKVTVSSLSRDRDKKIDKILTGRFTGYPLMILLVAFVFWITITGANYPSELLSELFLWSEKYILIFFEKIHMPDLVTDILVFGIYRVLTWVVSVMLPPMAIFFPLFTLLEDLGYLPRVAFNLDHVFQKCNACGKQALTICMGFGCNSAGVTGARIIDSERERLIAILTNCFVPCNGRFPILISVISIFFVSSSVFSSVVPALMLTLVVFLGLIMTFIISKILSKTCLKGTPSAFTLELPPFRKPQIGKIIVRSIFDRTLFVLGRAVAVAAPAGLIIWVMSNLQINSMSVLSICSDFLDPFARLLGLDGVILIAFILGFPANEIVIPLTVMGYTFSTNLQQVSDLETLKEIFLSNGWTPVTAICFIVFTLMHWPCSTTCITMYKETKSKKWTLLGFLIPTVCGMLLCFLINLMYKIITAIN